MSPDGRLEKRPTSALGEVHDVDIRIGIMNVARELHLEVADDDAESVKVEIEAAVAGDDAVLWLTDRDGRRVGVPIARLGYVEMGATGGRTIGFGA
jgi:hypothetical protein